MQQEDANGGILEQVADISKAICWAEVSRRYLGKSPSWLSLKMRGKGFNGAGGGAFTDEEREALRAGLQDLAERIRKASEALK